MRNSYELWAAYIHLTEPNVKLSVGLIDDGVLYNIGGEIIYQCKIIFKL